MPLSTVRSLGALIFFVVNITLELWVIFGVAFKGVFFILGNPLECIFFTAFFTFIATVFSDTAFDRITWAFVQGWWSMVKLTRSVLGIKI